MIETEFFLWINETKGLCSGRTLAHCSSWQLGNLPPSGSHPLPPSASQPANLAFLLIVWLSGEGQTVYVTDPIHPGFAKTVPEQGLLQVVVGKWETTPPLSSCSIELFRWLHSECLEELRHSHLIQKDWHTQMLGRRWKRSTARGSWLLQVTWQWEELDSHLPRLWTPRLRQWCELLRPWYPEANLVFYLSVHSSPHWLRR